ETSSDQTQVRSAPAFDMNAPSAKPAEPAEEIPDFLRAAGWGQATGAFDESKSVFTEAERQSPASGEPLEQGELPDWIKAMAPQQSAESPQPGPEEEMPDWINKIGTSALPIPSESAEEPDWMKQSDQSTAQPAEDQPDWLKQLDNQQQLAVPS